MAAGWTTTGSLADSLDDVRSSAVSTREYEGVMPQLVDKQTLPEGIGNSWQEIKYAALVAQAETETEEIDNPQQIADSLLTVTPTMVVVETFITDRVKARISKIGLARIGRLGQEAIQRKKDEDGLTLFATGATTSEPGSGATMTSGYISSSKSNISSNVTEPGNPPYRGVLHGFQIHDLYSEATAGVGTYPIPEGLTARVFAEGFRGMVGGVEIFENGNITITSSNAIGGVFSMEGIVLVQGRAPRVVSVRNEKRGGGGEHIYHRDEYAYGERPSAGYGWVYRQTSDATAPTS